ncbi:hypothetical protein ABIA39_005664 [Nocardia sp. GAS34]|uniref:acyclic terpene utilization AtuA family protein n=1 Tax=unclassified Nocardia TaxID=2637762 RepID=UPI003D1E1EF2
MSSTSDRLRVIVPTGMLGGGFPVESITRGIESGADAIVVDAGSTDSGPYYLGAGVAKTSAAAVRRDVEVLLTAAVGAGIPLIISSCGTGGTDAGVDWVADMVTDIAAAERLSFRLAKIYSDQNIDVLLSALDAGRIKPLPPQGPLQADTLRSCAHVVGMLGRELIADAIRDGAQVVLTGRATDTTPLTALALLRNLPPGPALHAAKTTECGGLCTLNPLVGVLVDIDRDGFTIESLDEHSATTPTSVAAHMLYENFDPFRLREPSGTLDTSPATYTALDERRVRVEGAQFRDEQYTIKLEGSAPAGFETMSLVGIRDPKILADLSTWTALLEKVLAQRVQDTLGLDTDAYNSEIRCYGADAILGPLEPQHTAPREVGVQLRVRAADQETSTSIAKIANPLLLHLPLPGMEYLPTYAFSTSPAEIERGVVYEFVLNHAVDVDTPAELFRTEYSEVHHA